MLLVLVSMLLLLLPVVPNTNSSRPDPPPPPIPAHTICLQREPPIVNEAGVQSVAKVQSVLGLGLADVGMQWIHVTD